MRRAAPSLLLVVALTALAACEKVPAPTSDSTPPTLTWHVQNLGTDATTDITGTGTVSGGPDDGFRVTVTAKDPEGIKQITLGGGYTRGCLSGDIGQNATGDFAGQQQDLSPDGDGNVLTSIFLINTYRPDRSCPAGYTWTGTTIQLVGTGTNYFGGTTTGTLTLSVAP